MPVTGGRRWRGFIIAATALAPALIAASCSFEWDAFDPRLAPESAQASSGGAGGSAPDAGNDATADAPGPDAGSGGQGGQGGNLPTHVTEGLLALYTFEEGQGDTVNDVSNAGTPLDLTIIDPANANWVSGGLEITASTIVRSAGAATKIVNGCKATDEISIGAWFTPANFTQSGPARIVTNSPNTGVRNFTLGQSLDVDFSTRLRNTLDGGLNGAPATRTPNAGGDVVLQLTHVSYTRDTAGERRIYVNGTERGADNVGGDLSNWDDTFPFALANEITLDRTWLGSLFRVAIYGRALTPAEVQQNFDAGP